MSDSAKRLDKKSHLEEGNRDPATTAAHPDEEESGEELMSRIKNIALLLVFLSILPVIGLGAEGPDAKISLRAGAVATGTGFSWGTGTLTFKGREHYFSVNGLSVGDFGGADASGQVYYLNKIEDFDGYYTAVRTGILPGLARSAVTLKNEKGVRIRLSALRRRTPIKIVGGGVEMKLK